MLKVPLFETMTCRVEGCPGLGARDETAFEREEKTRDSFVLIEASEGRYQERSSSTRHNSLTSITEPRKQSAGDESSINKGQQQPERLEPH